MSKNENPTSGNFGGKKKCIMTLLYIGIIDSRVENNLYEIHVNTR